MQSEISYPRNFAHLERGLLAAARSSKRRDAASGSRTKPFTPWPSTSSNENKERVPLLSGRHGGKVPNTGLYCDAGNRAVLDGSRAPKILVEVRGVEPLSEMESPKLLRVYAAFDLGCGTPTTGLIRTHPHDSAPCSEQEDPPAAWPDRLCLPAHRTSAGRHCGLYLGGKSVIVVRNYSFSRFLRGQRGSTTRDLTSTHPVETGSPPLGSTRILYQIFMPHAPSCRHSSAPS